MAFQVHVDNISLFFFTDNILLIFDLPFCNSRHQQIAHLMFQEIQKLLFEELTVKSAPFQVVLRIIGFELPPTIEKFSQVSKMFWSAEDLK